MANGLASYSRIRKMAHMDNRREGCTQGREEPGEVLGPNHRPGVFCGQEARRYYT